jgi:hypothetical protein
MSRGSLPPPHTDFAEALEARDLGLAAQLLHGRVALGLAVAVARLLLVAHPEQRGLQHEEVAVVDELARRKRRKKVMSRLRMCSPSTSASVARMTFS